MSMWMKCNFTGGNGAQACGGNVILQVVIVHSLNNPH